MSRIRPNLLTRMLLFLLLNETGNHGYRGGGRDTSTSQPLMTFAAIILVSS